MRRGNNHFRTVVHYSSCKTVGTNTFYGLFKTVLYSRSNEYGNESGSYERDGKDSD
jgi:hypothetical protein